MPLTCKIHSPQHIHLKLSTLDKKFSRRHFEIFFFFFPRKQILTFYANCFLSCGDNLHKMSNPIYWKNMKKYDLSSAESAQNVAGFKQKVHCSNKVARQNKLRSLVLSARDNNKSDKHAYRLIDSQQRKRTSVISKHPNVLTHLCREDSSVLTLWTGPFPIERCLVKFYFYHVLKKFLYLKQIV